MKNIFESILTAIKNYINTDIERASILVLIQSIIIIIFGILLLFLGSC